MTLLEVLQLLCQRLVDVLDRDDRDDLSFLLTTFAVLGEISYQGQNGQLTVILADLDGAAQDGVMGAKGKNPVPSVQEIEAAVTKS